MREELTHGAAAFGAGSLPAGVVDLAVAQNHLAWERLAPALAALPALAPADIHYQDAAGDPRCRGAIANLFNRTHGCDLDATHVVLASGAAAIIEMLGFALSHTGAVWLCPTPWYPSFAPILKLRANIDLVPVLTHASQRFHLQAEALDAAFEQAVKAGRRPSAVLVSSPHNPLGRHLYHDEWAAIQHVCAARDLHCILDALYLHSNHGHTPAIAGVDAPAFEAGRLHVVYGLAKDWGLSGVKLGALLSRNPQVLSLTRAMAHLSAPGSLAQHLARHLLDDSEWTTSFLAANRQQLAQACGEFIQLLDDYGLPYIQPDAGLFLWVDLGRLLKAPTAEAEAGLAEDLRTRWNVALGAGMRFGCDRPGWFRVCFALPQSDRQQAIAALQACFTDAGLAPLP